MREALFLVVAVTAFTAAFLMPGEAEEATDPAATVDAPRTDDASRASAKASASPHEIDNFSQWSVGETALPRAGDGHFYATVDVNGRTVNTMVDTGASVVALTGNDARALGFSWSDSEIQVIGSGASGAVEGVPITLNRITLGRHEAVNVDAVIIPGGLEVTLLGQSFLGTINPVRIEDDRMILGR